MEYLVNEGVLWICEKLDDGHVSFYVVFKHGDDDYGSWAFDLSHDDFSKLGTEFTTLENLKPFFDAITEVFCYYGGSSRGSLKDEIEEFDQYNEYIMIDTLSCADFKKILETELICID